MGFLFDIVAVAFVAVMMVIAAYNFAVTAKILMRLYRNRRR